MLSVAGAVFGCCAGCSEGLVVLWARSPAEKTSIGTRRQKAASTLRRRLRGILRSFTLDRANTLKNPTSCSIHAILP